MEKLKVRFAPSPTGPLHIGGARSALFNYLYARNQGGSFLLRIEDTDLERSKMEYEREIVESLSWLGMTWDEGIDIGGDKGPYRQTERLDTYQRYSDMLLRNGQAYHCFCTEEELEEERTRLIEKGETPRYLGKCRNLTSEERDDRLRNGIMPTVRFRVPEGTSWSFDDIVRDCITFESDTMGDFIIVKSDGIPTYNFAVVIDDHEMEVTHVVRAEEHLSNTPRQLMIYDALGFARPEFAHISLILGADRQKMSKRHGATSVVQYREKGYLPEALFNFLALLGWSPDGEQVILDREEIIKQFSLDRVAKNPAVFDLDKLNWINSQYIKRKKSEELGDLLKPYWERSDYKDKVDALESDSYMALVEAIRERLNCLSDAAVEVSPFFAEPEYDESAMEDLRQADTQDMLRRLIDLLPERLPLEEAHAFMKQLPKKLDLPPKKVYMPLRIALTGLGKGPDLPYLITVMGTWEVKRRLLSILV